MTSVQLEDYFRSAFRSRFLVKMPERDEKHVSPATRLLEKRRETAEVEHALSAQKEEFSMKMEGLAQRRQELERKEQTLKQSLQKFDRFLKENDNKKLRALKKAKEERVLIGKKEHQIEELKSECRELETERDQFKKKLEKYTIYQEYLERVLEFSDEFKDLHEIMKRYDTLRATNNDLVEREQKNQEVMENEKQKFYKYMENKNTEMLHYNNELAQLQTRLDRAQSATVHWESKWTHIQNTAAKKTLLLGRIKIATHNLYQLVLRHQKSNRTGEADEDRDDEADKTDAPRERSAGVTGAGSIENATMQLDRIQNFIQDLTQITADIKRQDVNDLKSWDLINFISENI